MYFLLKLRALAGVYLGWGVGANDTANMFGTAVASRLLSYKQAVFFGATFTFLGAVIGGAPMMDDVGTLLPPEFLKTGLDPTNLSFIAAMSGAIAITFVTWLAIPASTSQAAMGALMGMGIAVAGFKGASWGPFGKMFACWVFTPIASGIITALFIWTLIPLFNRLVKNEARFHSILKFMLISSGSYGCYMLGASHAAVTTGAFYKAGFFGEVGNYTSKLLAATAGGFGIALGVITYSKKVIETVGRKITDIDPVTAFLTVLAAAITVNIFKDIGVPVSTSQAIVGAVIGSGIVRSGKTISVRTSIFIFIGWILTPLAGALAAWAGFKIYAGFF